MATTSTPGEVPPEKVARYETNYSLCIICQTQTREPLVEKPSAHEKVLQFIRERSGYGDSNFPEVHRRIGDASADELQTNSTTKKQFMLVTAAGQRLAMKSAYPPRVRTSMYQLLTRQVLSPVLIQYPTTRNYVFSVIIKLCSNNLYTCSQQRMQASH